MRLELDGFAAGIREPAQVGERDRERAVVDADADGCTTTVLFESFSGTEQTSPGKH